MARIALFILVVLSSGWLLGYLLARAAESEAGPTAGMLAISFAAVLTPALMAWFASDPAGRRKLVNQFRFRVAGMTLAVTLGLPALLHIAGALAGILASREVPHVIPSPASFGAALQLLPMTLVWGVLEEIGWRGFLVVRLSRFVSAAKASLAAGLIWGLWHAPQVWFSDLPYGGAFRETPLVGAGLWMAATLAYGSVLGWLQLTSRSFVLPSVCHALVNVVSAAFAETRGDLDNPVWGGTGGLVAISVASWLAIALFRTRPPACLPAG